MEMDECVFNEFIHFVLQTVSSEEYLNELGIYRPPMVSLMVLRDKMRTQTATPGLYAVDYGGIDSVHYFCVRKEANGNLVICNGYKSKEGMPYGIGLDAQSDHSHGLCQTFALMFYMR